MKNILVVDDEKVWIKDFQHIFRNYSVTAYQDFYKALKFVKTRKMDLYLVDMKPVRGFTEKNKELLTEKEREILALPEEIFYAVREKGWEEGFYFISNHQSPHDEEVLARTGAKFVSKSEYQELERICKTLS